MLYTGAVGGGVRFAGVIDSTPFLSVTFSGTQNDDGIDFDRLQYKFEQVGPGVPEPATWGLMLVGFALVGATQRRRARHAIAA